MRRERERFNGIYRGLSGAVLNIISAQLTRMVLDNPRGSGLLGVNKDTLIRESGVSLVLFTKTE